MTTKAVFVMAFMVPIIFRIVIALILLQAQLEIETITLRYPIILIGLTLIVICIQRIFVLFRVLRKITE